VRHVALRHGGGPGRSEVRRVRRDGRLTVQGINLGWFERRGWAGFWCWLTIQGIGTGWFEWRGWGGPRRHLRRADGGARSGGAGVGGVRGLPGWRRRQEYFAADERGWTQIKMLLSPIGSIARFDREGAASVSTPLVSGGEVDAG
jgi:hypothetical protein